MTPSKSAEEKRKHRRQKGGRISLSSVVFARPRGGSTVRAFLTTLGRRRQPPRKLLGSLELQKIQKETHLEVSTNGGVPKPMIYGSNTLARGSLPTLHYKAHPNHLRVPQQRGLAPARSHPYSSFEVLADVENTSCPLKAWQPN